MYTSREEEYIFHEELYVSGLYWSLHVTRAPDEVYPNEREHEKKADKHQLDTSEAVVQALGF